MREQKIVVLPEMYVRFTKMGIFITGHVAKITEMLGNDTDGWRYVAVCKTGRAFYPMRINENLGHLNSCVEITKEEYDNDNQDLTDLNKYFSNSNYIDKEKLIAAAPDLLEALLALKSWVGKIQDWSGVGDPPTEIVDKALEKLK